jgi:hypothetical protein
MASVTSTSQPRCPPVPGRRDRSARSAGFRSRIHVTVTMHSVANQPAKIQPSTQRQSPPSHKNRPGQTSALPSESANRTLRS